MTCDCELHCRHLGQEGCRVSSPTTPVTREEFEAWASEPPRDWPLDRYKSDGIQFKEGEYVSRYVWQAWEAVQWATSRIEK